MKKLYFAGALIFSSGLPAQSNTAEESGSIGKCSVWKYPYTLYNNSGATQNISDAVTVTVDQNRNIGVVNLNGSGALNFSGANGITLSGSGTEINCRWDIPAKGSFTLVNNNNTTTQLPVDHGTLFTAPYTGDYIWIRNSGWSASVSGAHLNGGIFLKNNTNAATSSIFYQNQAGSCGYLQGVSGVTPPTWVNVLGPTQMNAGSTLSYLAGTGYNNNSSCNNTTMSYTIGTSVVVLEN